MGSYYRAHYYSPDMGRFISEDSYGFASGDVNFYAYALGNPISYSDPSGHIAWFVVLIWAGIEIALSIYDALREERHFWILVKPQKRKQFQLYHLVSDLRRAARYQWREGGKLGAGQLADNNEDQAMYEFTAVVSVEEDGYCIVVQIGR